MSAWRDITGWPLTMGQGEFVLQYNEKRHPGQTFTDFLIALHRQRTDLRPEEQIPDDTLAELAIRATEELASARQWCIIVLDMITHGGERFKGGVRISFAEVGNDLLVRFPDGRELEFGMVPEVVDACLEWEREFSRPKELPPHPLFPFENASDGRW